MAKATITDADLVDAFKSGVQEGLYNEFPFEEGKPIWRIQVEWADLPTNHRVTQDPHELGQIVEEAVRTGAIEVLIAIVDFEWAKAVHYAIETSVTNPVPREVPPHTD